MTTYDQQLAADRQATAYGTAHHSANPPTYHAQPKAQPATLTAPTAGALTHGSDSTAFQRAGADANHAAQQLDAYVDSLRGAAGDTKYTSENIRDHVAQFAHTPAAQAVERSVDAVRVTAEAAQLAADRALERLQPKGDTATELRNSRYWNRVEAQLDSIADGGKRLPVVDELIKNANPNELGVLIEELPAYLRAKGSDASFVDELVAQAVPEYGAAKRRVGVAQQALTIAEANARRLQQRYTTAYPQAAGFQTRPSAPLAFADRAYDPELV